MQDRAPSGVAIVTGASRGIGAATARLAASSGYDVVVGYRVDRSAADAVVHACEAFGRRSLAVACDVAVEADVIELFDVAGAAFGPPTLVVNNAAIIRHVGRLEDFDAARLRDVVGVNVIGAMLVAREAIRRMSTRRGGAGGSIVNVSSAAAYLGSPDEFVDYAATKGALDTLTIGLAKEVARDGIRVNAVRPGLIDTSIHAGAGAPDRVERLSAGVPMGRGGTPDEVAHTIVWLASPAASYVTGALVNCSGGR